MLEKLRLGVPLYKCILKNIFQLKSDKKKPKECTKCVCLVKFENNREIYEKWGKWKKFKFINKILKKINKVKEKLLLYKNIQ